MMTEETSLLISIVLMISVTFLLNWLVDGVL